MVPSTIELVGTILFGFAILHTFLASRFQHLSHRFPATSMRHQLFHLLGEIETVFGIWATIFIVCYRFIEGSEAAIHYLETRDFTEPLFVFVIMALCATKPILEVVELLIIGISKLLPLPATLSFFLSALVIGPLLGSFITEPAAMTVTALLLLQKFYSQPISSRLKYATLGLLFVNVSVGGTLTPYAAPPVLMVAQKWNWDLSFMLTHFGWKAVTSVLVSTLLFAIIFQKEFKKIKIDRTLKLNVPAWIIAVHFIFLMIVVLNAHHPVIFTGAFLLLLGFITVTKQFQSALKIRESLLVGFFLAGLVVFGGEQRWWLDPLLKSLGETALYLGATALTAITDNAALTYLGSQVENLTDSAKYFLVAGAVVGGGLTVIANAPNPAGFGILNSAFGRDGISPLKLFLSALIPTLIALFVFWLP